MIGKTRIRPVYTAPSAQVVEVTVERGFAATSNAPQWDETPW